MARSPETTGRPRSRWRGESLGVHRDVHDAVESGEREQARGQQE
jgi:hypothetical protein